MTNKLALSVFFAVALAIPAPNPKFKVGDQVRCSSGCVWKITRVINGLDGKHRYEAAPVFQPNSQLFAEQDLKDAKSFRVPPRQLER